jgi:hypothetical protein
MFFIVLSVQFFCYDCFAEISDEYTVRIKSGQPAVLPSVAKVNEEVQFNFSVNLCDKNDKQVEEIPEDEISSINYMLTSYKLTSSSPPHSIYDSFGAIERCHPNLTIASHKKSASKTVQEFYQKVSATTQYPTTGEYKLSLFVTIKFSDNSTCFDIHDINVKVADAILTVYAKGPDKIVFLTGPLGAKIPATVMIDPANPAHDFIGHSFWKCEVDQSLLSSQSQKNLSGHKMVIIPNLQCHEMCQL